MAPPTKLSLAHVPGYLADEHNIGVTRQTVYNWTKTGRGGSILRTCRGRLGVVYTTEKWVDMFVGAVSPGGE